VAVSNSNREKYFGMIMYVTTLSIGSEGLIADTSFSMFIYIVKTAIF